MPELVHFAADAPADDVVMTLQRDGAVILDALLSGEETDSLRGELMPWIEATPPGRDSFSGARTTRTGALVARSPRCRAAIMDARIRALCDRVLLAACERYQLHLTQAIRIRPGQEAQPIHRDRWAWGTHLSSLEPQLNTIWALTDFTRANGATQVAPGSVTWPDDRRPTPDEIGWAEMKRGSALAYLGSVFHGGGANTTDIDRIGLNITYALGWLRQEENQYLSCPPAIAATLEPELQALIGYAMGSYALGYFTPPLEPGAGPEVVPPNYALGAANAGGTLGASELLHAISRKVSSGEDGASDSVR
jgi:hypothetical protein